MEVIRHLSIANGQIRTIHKDVLVDIRMENRIIYAVAEHGCKYRISRKLNPEMGPFMFIDYLLSRPNTYLGREDIGIKVGSSDLTELINACGFTRNLKRIFFPSTTEVQVFFTRTVRLNQKELDILEAHKWISR